MAAGPFEQHRNGAADAAPIETRLAVVDGLLQPLQALGQETSGMMVERTRSGIDVALESLRPVC